VAGLSWALFLDRSLLWVVPCSVLYGGSGELGALLLDILYRFTVETTRAGNIP
jgi:hypothetical protein